jgi:predicted Zn-dependent protease
MLKQNPDDNFLNHALALEYAKLNQMTKSIDILKNLLRRDPGYIGSYYHLAGMLALSGQTEEANFWYDKGMTAARTLGDDHAFNELRSAWEELNF